MTSNPEVARLFDQMWRTAAGWPVSQAHHSLCQINDTLADLHYFHPPTPPTGGPILRVTAFHLTMPREGWTFERAALGEQWRRTA